MRPAEEAVTGTTGRGGWAAVVVVLAAVVLAVGVALHVTGLDGPWYWKWPWFVMPARRWYSWMLVAALPVVFAADIEMRAAGRRGRAARWRAHVVAVALLTAAVPLMKIVALSCFYRDLSLLRIGGIVVDPISTSYYTDAGAVDAAWKGWSWLGTYPAFLPRTQLHTQSKPPGPVVYHLLFVRAMGFGSMRGAQIDGVVLALLAALSIPATYWLLRVLTHDASAALVGTIMLALCPGFILIYPTFDAALVALAAAVLACWHLALWRDEVDAPAWALACGVLLALTLFMTYTQLVLGFFMAGDAVVAWCLRPTKAWRTTRLAAMVLVVLSGITLVYLALFVLTAFDPILTFRVAWRNQQRLLAGWGRPYPWTILFDLTDFIYSAAWVVAIPVTLGIAHFVGQLRRSAAARGTALPWLVLLAVAQPLVVAGTGLVQTETARVWNFMLPLFLVPAALEMTRWRAAARGVVYASMLLLLLVIGQNMQFLSPGPYVETRHVEGGATAPVYAPGPEH